MSATTVRALAQKKAQRQKKILAVSSVILLAVVGFQLTRVLGGGKNSAAPAVLSTAASLPVSPLAAPLAAVPAKLPNTDRIVIPHDSDQLLSFGLFKSKDPFVQQLSSKSPALPSLPVRKKTIPAPKPPNAGVGLTPVTTTTTPTSTVPTPANPVPPATTTPSTTPAAPTTAPTSVLISTNGICQTVALNGTFPATEDIFRVVSIAQDGKSIKIGVVGGAYDSGQVTATLKLGEKLTLVNTADGTRYVIALEAKCDVQTAPTSTTPTSPTVTTTTPVPATPAPTATTPIVTDSLDTTTTPPFG
jgi:hypothetical protein